MSVVQHAPDLSAPISAHQQGSRVTPDPTKRRSHQGNRVRTSDRKLHLWGALFHSRGGHRRKQVSPGAWVAGVGQRPCIVCVFWWNRWYIPLLQSWSNVCGTPHVFITSPLVQLRKRLFCQNLALPLPPILCCFKADTLRTLIQRFMGWGREEGVGERNGEIVKKGQVYHDFWPGL